LLGLADDEWVKDIGRMAWFFGKRHSRLFYSKVKVNPANLSSVGGFGADADLFIDGYIIDIKTVQHPVLQLPAMPSLRFIAIQVLAARSQKLFIGLHCNSEVFMEVLQRFCSAPHALATRQRLGSGPLTLPVVSVRALGRRRLFPMPMRLLFRRMEACPEASSEIWLRHKKG
jgi:hypothetical protein